MKIIIVGSNSQCFGVLYNFVNNSNGLATSGLSSLIGGSSLELLSTINHLRHSRIFGCKTNSLTGDMSKLVGYKGE